MGRCSREEADRWRDIEDGSREPLWRRRTGGWLGSKVAVALRRREDTPVEVAGCRVWKAGPRAAVRKRLPRKAQENLAHGMQGKASSYGYCRKFNC